MANPQKENGYTPIANEILSVLCCLHLSGNEWSYLHAVLRKTYGFNKKEDWITNTQITQMTGMGPTRVSEAKRALVALKIVTENRNKISLQKDYSLWKKLRKTVTKKPEKVTENRNLELRKSVYTKDNITKDNISERSSHKKMKKNSFRYQENKHQDFEDSIDSDTREKIEDPEDRKTEAVNKLLKWAEELRGKRFIDTPTQRKFIHQLRDAKFSPVDIKNSYRELLQSEYWRNQDRLPDFKTVYSNLKNKK